VFFLPGILERFNFEKVETLHADFSENQRSETVARRTCFAVKQLFQSENAVGNGVCTANA
jgi:hypothetical protein